MVPPLGFHSAIKLHSCPRSSEITANVQIASAILDKTVDLVIHSGTHS